MNKLGDLNFKGTGNSSFSILKRKLEINGIVMRSLSPSRREFSSTHAYVLWLADVHLAGFAPAFTLSLCDSECSRKPPVPIASVVTSNFNDTRQYPQYCEVVRW